MILNHEYYSAPTGGRVTLTSGFALCIVPITVVAEVAVFLKGHVGGTPHMVPAPAYLAPFAAMAIMTGVFLFERHKVSRFRIEDGALVLGCRRYPLTGLTSAARDPDVMKGAVKLWGNGGLGAVRGRFWSRRLGRFQAFMSDTKGAVVLRWSKLTVAVSPAEPESFLHAVRAAAGLGDGANPPGHSHG